jgi:glyoxylase-like metal-dependent hydrolase (beta-lactamase superfamily II)
MKILYFTISFVWSTATWALAVQVDVFSAPTANVNSFIFSDSVGSVIVDATRTSKDAIEVVKLMRRHGGGLQTIFITHGHPDHYLGLGELKRQFPEAKVFVATEQIKNDIISFAKKAQVEHWLSDEPFMVPKSELSPQGFDYENEIHVLPQSTLVLPGGMKLDVMVLNDPTEAAHETMLYSKDLHALFASDLVYNKVHLWLAGGVDAGAIQNWRHELRQLKSKYAPLKVTVYPGHGNAADASIFDVDINYLNDFLGTIRESKTQAEAEAKMIKKYPSWENSDFILKQSIKSQFEQLRK